MVQTFAPDRPALTEQLLHLLMDSGSEYALMLLDPAGKVSRWSVGAQAISGYTAEEIVGRHLSFLYPPEEIASGRPDRELAAAAAGRTEEEGWRVRKDGSLFWANVITSAVHDENGELIGFAKIWRDTSERRRLEDRFRKVFEAAPNAMVMINAAGTIEMVNAQAERLFGYPREEMLGQPIEMLVPSRFRVHHPELRGGFFADPRSRLMGAGRDLFARRKDGSECPVEIGLNPIATEEGSMVLSAVVDISDRKQKEERIQAALREKDMLLGEIHHRVKNNLQIVDSLLGLQSARISDPRVIAMLRDSQNRIRSMALIHQTLYGSKDFAKVDFGLFLDSLVPTLIGSYGINTDRVTLAIDVVQVQLPISAAVPCGLIVNELISNALKHAFGPEERGQISVSLQHVADNEVMLTVADTGRGIPEDFDLASTTTLGLQLVTMLTDQVGGELTIRRANPTRFVLRFPIER
jgi:PAS domain S-box-containing protein